MKVVINKCFGGFCLSEKAYAYLGIPWDGYGFKYNYNRTSPELVECVEALGEDANGSSASLKVVDVPDDVDWFIHDYDGVESIHEEHRVWE